MQEELDALKENHTWDVVQCPPSVKRIRCKWVYSIKLNPNGTLAHYNARLVALGNHQEYGIDYMKRHMLQSPKWQQYIPFLLLQYHAHGLPIKWTWRMPPSMEILYRRCPCVFLKVMILLVRRKWLRSAAPYMGLKQAPKAWFEKIRSTLPHFGFGQSPYDPSLFTNITAQGTTLLLIYVDNIVITGAHSNRIHILQSSLQAAFHTKDLGPLTYFLGLVVQ